MRQAVLAMVVLAAIGFTGCGGGGSSSSSSSTPGSVELNAATYSLNQGFVIAVSATVLDSTGVPATNPVAVTYSTDNPAIATINSSTGQLCGGVWDSNYVVCAPGQIGTATITATSGTLKATATVYVHQKVDRIAITTPTGACKSVGQTLQLSAIAYSNGADVTSTVGPLLWGVKNTSVASVDSTGLLTAQAPGNTGVFASISNVASVPVPFTTCAVRSIHVHLAGAADTAFTLASKGATQQLTADVVDSAGNSITPSLNWVSLDPTVVSVSSAGLVTALAPGTTSILPECALTCNYNLSPAYGDVSVATVSGTSASTVYVTGTGATQLIPIDTGTNAAGTAITLPSQPNSMMFLPNGVSAYLGSSGGVITLNAAANSVSQNTALPGKVLAVSPDSNLVIIADTSSVYIQNASTGGATNTLAISGATAAAFSSDSTYAYIAAGSTLYLYAVGLPNPTSISLSAAANDVAIAPSSAFAFLAGGAPNAISVRSTCDNSGVTTFPTPGMPTQLGVTPDAAKVLAVDSPKLDVLTRSSLAQPGCPPPFSAAVNSVDLGQGAFTARQFLVSGSGAKAYILSNLPNIIAFNVNAGSASAISLSGGATGLSESLTLDGAQLYVGGSDNNVHRIDTSAGTDAQQISVSFMPNLVAVRPK